MWRCPSPACQGTGGPSTRWSWTGRRTTLPASCFPSAWRKELSPPRSTNTEPPRKGIADQGRAGRFRVLPGPVQAGRTVWAGADIQQQAAGIAGRQSPQERRHFRRIHPAVAEAATAGILPQLERRHRAGVTVLRLHGDGRRRPDGKPVHQRLPDHRQRGRLGAGTGLQ